MVSTAEPVPGTDCQPDRSFSYPKGMRSGVEGPGVFYRKPQLLACKGRCMWRDKPKPNMRPLTLPALAKSAWSRAPGKERRTWHQTEIRGLLRRIEVPFGIVRSPLPQSAYLVADLESPQV